MINMQLQNFMILPSTVGNMIITGIYIWFLCTVQGHLIG